jgi:hypothetical protein
MLAGALLGCERPTAPGERAVVPMNVPTLPVRDAIAVGEVLTDVHLRADPLAACARGPIVANPPRARNAEMRVVATRFRDGSLVRFRGMLDTVGLSVGWFEMTRDWPNGTGLRVGQWDAGDDEVVVLRYGPGARGRVSDERALRDAGVASSFSSLRRPYADLECPVFMHRNVDYGTLLPNWESTRDDFHWRDAWPPRSRGGR